VGHGRYALTRAKSGGLLVTRLLGGVAYDGLYLSDVPRLRLMLADRLRPEDGPTKTVNSS
jgi:hypothetical protein